jgi:hypothetical protein
MSASREPRPGECWRWKECDGQHARIRDVVNCHNGGGIPAHVDVWWAHDGPDWRFMSWWLEAMELCTEHPPLESRP